MITESQSPAVSARVTVRLCSGLGNQLFQYACGLAEARRRNALLKCDTTWYSLIAKIHEPMRSLRLHELGLSVEESFCGWRKWMIGLAAAAFDRTGRGRTFLERLGEMKVIQETQALQKRSWEGALSPHHVYLNGYWQTSDHFLAVRQELQRKIRSRPLTSSGAQDMNSRINRRQSGFIHIRRGDYTTLVGDAGLLPVQYYKSAVQMIGGSGWHWFVFSEDEDWAKSNMGFLSSWELVTYKSANRDIDDLQLMAACEAGIIANSSYSWWGAALGERPRRPIFAPNRYWNRDGSGVDDWALPEWTQVAAWD